MAKKEQRPFIEVVWLDASSTDGWIDESTDLSPPQMTTRGWLYKETDTYVTLVNTLRGDQEGGVGGSNTIPKGMILSQRKLKVSNNVRRKRVVSTKQKAATASDAENTQNFIPSADKE